MSDVSHARVQFRIQGPRPPLAVEFDPEWRAVYLRLRDDDVASTQEFDEGVAIDRDHDRRIVGIEIVGLGVERCTGVLERLRARYGSEAPELATVEVVAA